MAVIFLIRHVKEQLSASLHVLSEVCGMVCMLKLHANTASVLLMLNLFSLFPVMIHSCSKKTR